MRKPSKNTPAAGPHTLASLAADPVTLDPAAKPTPAAKSRLKPRETPAAVEFAVPVEEFTPEPLELVPLSDVNRLRFRYLAALESTLGILQGVPQRTATPEGKPEVDAWKVCRAVTEIENALDPVLDGHRRTFVNRWVRFANGAKMEGSNRVVAVDLATYEDEPHYLATFEDGSKALAVQLEPVV